MSLSNTLEVGRKQIISHKGIKGGEIEESQSSENSEEELQRLCLKATYLHRLVSEDYSVEPV